MEQLLSLKTEINGVTVSADLVRYRRAYAVKVSKNGTTCSIVLDARKHNTHDKIIKAVMHIFNNFFESKAVHITLKPLQSSGVERWRA